MASSLDRKFKWFKVSLKDTYNTRKDFIFRGATRRELKVYNDCLQANNPDSADILLNSCIQNCDNSKDLLPGTFETLLNLVIKHTGGGEDDVPFNKAKSWLESETGSFEAAAVMALPGLTFDILYDSDPIDYYRYLLIGKQLFERIFQINPSEAFKEGVKKSNAMSKNRIASIMGVDPNNLQEENSGGMFRK